MKCKDSNFWIGLGIGSVAGALAYHFSRTEKAKKLEDAICRAIHKASGEAKEFINTAEEEALHTGTKVADKMAHEVHEAAEKADNLKTRFTILPMPRNKTSTWKLLKTDVFDTSVFHIAPSVLQTAPIQNIIHMLQCPSYQRFNMRHQATSGFCKVILHTGRNFRIDFPDNQPVRLQ